jgi:hypothetical protein
MGKGMLAMATGIIALAGCSDPIWWTKPDFDQAQFNRDHYQCAKESQPDTFGTVGLYRMCMRAKGYTETTPPNR